MRKLLLLAVAFLLLGIATPAFAGTTATATVTINALETLDVTGSWAWTLTLDDYGSQPIAADTSTVALAIKSNHQFDVDAQITTDWAQGQGWTLELYGEVAPGWVDISGLGLCEILTDEPAGDHTGDNDYDIDARLSDVVWADVGDLCTVTFTFGV